MIRIGVNKYGRVTSAKIMDTTPPKRRGAKKQVLVQTLLPAELAGWTKKRATAKGLSMAAFLRVLLIDYRAMTELQ